MKNLLSAIVMLMALQGAAVLAQVPTPSPTPPSGRDDVIVISTNLVQIDATGTDKDGKVVPNLTADDFEIYENGKLQPITNFSFVELKQPKPAETARTEKDVKNNPPVPSTLRPEQVKRTIALVVDDLGLSFASVRWTKDALKKFVDEQMHPGDLVAIIRTGSGIGALQQFTSDKRLLYAAIEKIRWNPNGRGGISSFSPLEPSIKDQLSGVKDLSGENPEIKNIEGKEEDRNFERDVIESQEAIFSVGTLGAVSYVMRGMGQLPGRKAIMLFSDGFKLFSRKGPNTRVYSAIERLIDLANRTRTVVYTLDSRGLEVPWATAQDNTFGLSESDIDQRLTERRQDLIDTQQSLRTLAHETGGFAIINQNNLNKGLERILDDQKGYYLIGYEPDDDIFKIENRKFNKLVIKLKRPDLKVRYRSGFFGITDEEAYPKPKTAVQQLIAALTSPFAMKEVDIRMTPLFANDATTGSFMRALVYVNGSDLNFVEEKDGWRKAEFDVSVMTFGDNGEVVDQMNRKQTMRARAESLQDIYENGFVFLVTFPIQKPGSYQMRVAFRDSQTSLIGSASQYIEVPNLKKNRLALSGIVLENETAAKGKSLDSFAATLKTQRDAAMRRFRNGDAVNFGFSVYNAKIDKSTAGPRLVSQFKIFRDGKEIFASPEKPVSFIGQNPQSVDITGGFNLANNMPTGDYVLQVIVRDSLAKEKYQTVNQWIDFEIVK